MGRTGRKKAQLSPNISYGRGTLPRAINGPIDNEAQLLEALEIARGEIESGYPLAKDITNALLRLLRVKSKRSDENFIVNTVLEFDSEEHPVSEKAGKNKVTAFEMATQKLKQYWPKITASNVRRIYNKADKTRFQVPELQILTTTVEQDRTPVEQDSKNNPWGDLRRKG